VTKRSPSTSWSSANGRTQPAGRRWCLFSVGRDRPSTVPGLLPLPISSLKSGFPVLGNPANRNRAVPLSCFDHSLYAFANAVSERGEAAVRNLRSADTWQTTVPSNQSQPEPVERGEGRHRQPRAGPRLIISGKKTIPCRRRSPTPPTSSRTTKASPEIIEIKNRGHALTIDSSWREVADTALAFVNDSHSRPEADPSKRYAYAPTMAGHRDIGLGIRDDDRFLRRRTEFLSQRGRVASRSRMIRARPRRVGR
jgi:hypothetical protein